LQPRREQDLAGKKNNREVPMPMQREIQIPQAMQRHTGCAWVQPTRADETNEKEKNETSNQDATVAGRVLDPKAN
jgi:hypothetical protein